MGVPIGVIKKLREETQASVALCKKALEETGGDIEKAQTLLRKRGFEVAAKKAARKTGEGIIEAYIHQNGRVGAMVELLCETDFVARTAEFKYLAHELSMQVSAMNPRDVESLLKQEYIRDSSKTVEDLVKETIAQLGENIVVKRFSRFEV